MRADVVIVGGGVTGLGTALCLKVDTCLFEKERQLGGCLRSDLIDGYTIDRTGHLLHFRDEYVRSIMFDRLSIDWLHFKRNAEVFIQNARVPYPIQYHLHSLPAETRVECLLSYLETLRNHPSLENSFESWSRRSFGKQLHELFFAPYNAKLWQADLSTFNAEWAEKFVAMPDRELVIRGALGCHKNDGFGYNGAFSYPKRGGSQAIIDALAAQLNAPIRTGTELVAVDAAAQICEFSDGTRVKYEVLVTTTPLPRLLKILHRADPNIVALANQLRHNSLLYFVFGYKLKGTAPAVHWVYVPEEKYLMYRVGVLSNYSPYVAPPGCALLCAELAFPGDTARAADPDALREKVLADLSAIGMVDSSWTRNFEYTDVIDCAYVIFDKTRHEALPRILKYLQERKIYSIGRYGGWGYGSMGDALLEGRDCAETIHSTLGRTSTQTSP